MGQSPGSGNHPHVDGDWSSTRTPGESHGDGVLSAIWIPTCKRKMSEHFLMPHTRLQTKWVVDTRAEVTKPLEENREVCVCGSSQSLRHDVEGASNTKVREMNWTSSQLWTFIQKD